MEPSLELQLNKEIQLINSALNKCKLIEETLQTRGWKEVIEPLIDKSISDVNGAKVNGRWYSGRLDKARKDERREFYIGYKQALIDLHREVYAFNDNIVLLEEKKEAKIKSLTPKFKTPLVDDRRY